MGLVRFLQVCIVLQDVQGLWGFGSTVDSKDSQLAERAVNS